MSYVSKIKESFAKKDIHLQNEEIVRTQSGSIVGFDYTDQDSNSINIVKYPVDGIYGVFMQHNGRTRQKYSGNIEQICNQIETEE